MYAQLSFAGGKVFLWDKKANKNTVAKNLIIAYNQKFHRKKRKACWFQFRTSASSGTNLALVGKTMQIKKIPDSHTFVRMSCY